MSKTKKAPQRALFVISVLNLERDVDVSRVVARNFHANADFFDDRGNPGHVQLPLLANSMALMYLSPGKAPLRNVLFFLCRSGEDGRVG
jgi:hypothetical protein